MDIKKNNEQLFGEMEYDEKGRGFRLVNGKKIYQIEENTEQDRRTNEAINRIRSRPKGMSVHDFLIGG